jgi:nucleoside-diphosphate-sugar epimerase
VSLIVVCLEARARFCFRPSNAHAPRKHHHHPSLSNSKPHEHNDSDRPVPIPAPGQQLVTLTHVEDVASMLAAVPGNQAAVKQHYNVCSDRAVTFTGACMERALLVAGGGCV